MREVVSKQLKSTRPGIDPWGIGVGLGCFARLFGARAPTNWVAYQLFHDCVSTKIVYDDKVSMRDMQEGRAVVGLDFFSKLEEGIETALIDWWFTSTDFLEDYCKFKSWRGEMEDIIAWDIMIMDFREPWKDCIESNEMWLREKLEDMFLAKHKRLRADIEARAVQIGL